MLANMYNKFRCFWKCNLVGRSVCLNFIERQGCCTSIGALIFRIVIIFSIGIIMLKLNAMSVRFLALSTYVISFNYIWVISNKVINSFIYTLMEFFVNLPNSMCMSKHPCFKITTSWWRATLPSATHLTTKKEIRRKRDKGRLPGLYIKTYLGIQKI